MPPVQCEGNWLHRLERRRVTDGRNIIRCGKCGKEGKPQLDHVYRIVRLVHSLQPRSISTRVRTKSVFSHLPHFVIHGWKMCTSWAISNQRHFTVELYLLKSSIRRVKIQSSGDSIIRWYLLWYRNEVVNNFQVVWGLIWVLKSVQFKVSMTWRIVKRIIICLASQRDGCAVGRELSLAPGLSEYPSRYWSSVTGFVVCWLVCVHANNN